MSVKHGILAVLDRSSMHGYDLRRDLEDELGAAWAVNYGQIYTTLERMVRDGLVVQSETVVTAEAPDRKLYTITPAGRAELHRWFLAAEDDAESGRDELHAKIALSLTGDIDVEEVIQAQRRGQLRRIGLLTKRKEGLDADLDLGSLLSTDLEIAKSEAIVKWLDLAEERIAKAARTPPKGVSARARRTSAPASVATEPSARERTSGRALR